MEVLRRDGRGGVSEPEARGFMATILSSLHRDAGGQHRFGEGAVERVLATRDAMDPPTRIALANGLVALIDEIAAHRSLSSVAVLQLCALVRHLIGEGLDPQSQLGLDPRAAELIGQPFAWRPAVSGHKPAPGSFGLLGLRAHVNTRR